MSSIQSTDCKHTEPSGVFASVSFHMRSATLHDAITHGFDWYTSTYSLKEGNVLYSWNFIPLSYFLEEGEVTSTIKIGFVIISFLPS